MAFVQWSLDLRRLVLAAFILAGIYLSWLVLSPFLTALTWAAIFAILFERFQARLAVRLGRTGAAAATTLLVGLVIVAPALLLLGALARETPQVAAYLRESSLTMPRQIQPSGWRSSVPWAVGSTIRH